MYAHTLQHSVSVTHYYTSLHNTPFVISTVDGVYVLGVAKDVESMDSG